MDKQMLRTTITQLRQIALFAVGVSLLTACGNNQSGMKLGDNEFAVLAVNSTTSDQTTSYPATIRGTQDIEVRPQVSGFIVKLCVDEGATVRKGQALFQIDPTQYAAAVGQAKAAVEMAKANVATLTLTEKNKKALFDQKIISDFEYQTAVNQLMSAKASLAQAEASLVSANQNLSFCTVTSPSNGVVGTFPYRIGSLVSPSVSQPLTTVSEINDVYVYFSMTEKELLRLTRAGGTLKEQLEKMPAVRLQLSDGTTYQSEGKIDAVSGVIDQSTGSVSMRAVFPNDKNILRSGGTGNIIFPYTMDGIIIIPQSATSFPHNLDAQQNIAHHKSLLHHTAQGSHIQSTNPTQQCTYLHLSDFDIEVHISHKLPFLALLLPSYFLFELPKRLLPSHTNYFGTKIALHKLIL